MNIKNLNLICKHGFTLVELMIAIAISAIMMTAIITTFVKMHSIYDIQDQVSGMQQNVRASMLVLCRDVRMAGFGIGSTGSISYYDGSGTAYITSIASFNNNPDRIDLLYADASINASITSPMPDSSAEFNVDTTTGFEINDLVIITNGTDSSLLQVTTVQSAALKIQHNPGGNINPPGGHNIFPPGGYGAGTQLYKIRYVSYDIDFSDPKYPLMRVDPDGPVGSGSPQPFADNIEDLQFVYIFEDGDEADFCDDADADDTNDTIDVRSVRISILGRTDRMDMNFIGTRPAIEDHAAGFDDGYRRRLLSSVIRTRNIGL